ncbi:MAG TPA: hypothetical protein VK518_20660 [Puia sp.]|nr:hypothetical protein [Puia sp.]
MNVLPITFAFNTDKAFTIQLEAEVELPGSIPYYQVKNIHHAGNHHKDPIIPDILLKCVEKQDKRIWVHTDSNMPSDLSIAVGSVLESILPAIKIASSNDPIEKDDLSLA